MNSAKTTAVAVAGSVALVPILMLILLFAASEDEDCGRTGGTQAAAGDLIAPPGSFIKPVGPDSVTLTSGFGMRDGAPHQGIDLAGPIGTPIYAAADGVVIAAGAASGFGQWVVLDHQLGGQLVSTVYGHVDTYTVAAGQTVRAGQVIATIGNRGQSTGPHLHFEVWQGGHRDYHGGTAVDPQPLYDAAPAPGQQTTPTTPDPARPPAPPEPSPDATMVGAAPPGGQLSVPTPAGVGSEANLQIDGKRLMRALHARYGTRLPTIGGWRADGGGYGDHPEGRAIDAMIPDSTSGAGVALGDEIRDWVLANAGFFHVEYVIWRQTYYVPGQPGSPMADRGSPTANHFDHVHITVSGGGTNEAGVVWGTAPGGGTAGVPDTAGGDCATAPGVGDDVDPGTVPAEFVPWLRRAGALCPQITGSLLAAQLAAENGFRHGPGAPVSSTGAGGPAQFMPATWATYGRDYDGDGTVDINSIGDAVMAQGTYMCAIAATIDGWIADGSVRAPHGPTELYLAGYNAGEGAVHTAGGFPTGGDYTTQTRPYADKILAAEPTYRAATTG